jgi:hypothetical protein
MDSVVSSKRKLNVERRFKWTAFGSHKIQEPLLSEFTHFARLSQSSKDHQHR